MNLLGMFARRPEPGQTKTRLAATIGNEPAAELYAAFVEDLLHRCPGLAGRFLVAATPNNEATTEWFRSRMCGDSQLVFQPDGDLGKRIDWFFQRALADGAGSVVLIGSDNPDLPAGIISSAFERLAHVDVVISPAMDGGFVLIGLREERPKLFESIPWSSASTLHDTIAAARRLNLSVELLQPWYDIDVLENLGTLISLQETPTSGAADCPATLAVLRKLWPLISQSTESR